MHKKTSAFYQQQYRQRLREQGLVKKEVWILPEHAPVLAAMERKLRRPGVDASMDREERMNQPAVWTAKRLYEALAAAPLCTSEQVDLELIEGAEPSLHLTMHEFGDLPLFVAVYGDQIIIEALLWPVSDVRDPARFNEEVLSTHKLFPLASISLEALPDGTRCYSMFGALGAACTLESVLEVILTLADNVIRATEAYEGFLATTAQGE